MVITFRNDEKNAPSFTNFRGFGQSRGLQLELSFVVVSSLLNLPDQLTFIGGVALALVGIYLRWRVSDYSMQAEEYVKEGRLTEDQARWRIAVLNLVGPAAIIIGLAACVIVVWT